MIINLKSHRQLRSLLTPRRQTSSSLVYEPRPHLRQFAPSFDRVDMIPSHPYHPEPRQILVRPCSTSSRRRPYYHYHSTIISATMIMALTPTAPWPLLLPLSQ